MSDFFKEFPKVDYRFGDHESPVQFQHLGTYIDILDQVKDYIVFYENHVISNGERPDALSYRLYKNPNYYWTFWLLNNSIRQSGWPLRDAEVWPQAQKYYPNTCFTTSAVTQEKEAKLVETPEGSIIEWTPTQLKTPLCKSKNFRPGNWVWFKYSKTVGKILRIDQELGLLHVEMSGEYRKLDEMMESISEEDALEIQKNPEYNPKYQYEELDIIKHYDQFDAPHHYEDFEGNWISPTYSEEYPHIMDQTSVNSMNSVSYYQRLRETNDDQKIISVIKKESIKTIVAEFQSLLSD